MTGYSAYWIGQLAHRYNEQGPAGRHNRQHTTSRRTAPLLSPALQEELREELQQALAGPAPEEDRWSGRTVAEWMAARLAAPSRVTAAGSLCIASSPSPATGCPDPVMRWPTQKSKRPSKNK